MKTIADFSTGRENNFDFIRMLAAFMVMFSHSYPLTFGENDNEPLFVLTGCQTDFGITAVSIFFIISGFLVSQSLVRKKNLADYFRARILRIFPALIVMILLVVFVAGPILTSLSFKDYFTHSDTYTYLTMMYVFNNKVQDLPGVFVNNPYHHVINGSLWTIRYELTCYIALPAIVLLFRKQVVTSLVLTAAVIYIAFNLFFAPEYLIVLFSLCFLSGSLFYFFRNKIPMHWMIAVVAAGLLVVSVPLRLLQQAFPWLVGYLVIYLALVPKSRLTRFGKYGDFSYGFYIWAFPIQQIVAQYYSHLGTYFNVLISFPFVLLLAIGSWHLIEKPALEWKSKSKVQLESVVVDN